MRYTISFLVEKIRAFNWSLLYKEGGESSGTKGSSSKKGEEERSSSEEMRSSDEEQDERQNNNGEWVSVFPNACPCCDRNECSCTAHNGQHNLEVSPGRGALIPGDTERVCCHCGSSDPSVCCWNCQCTFCGGQCGESHDVCSSPGETYSTDDSHSPEDSKKESSKGKKRKD